MEKEKSIKKYSYILTIAFLLFILGLISVFILFRRIIYFSERETENILPLTGSSIRTNEDAGDYYGDTFTYDDANEVWKNTTYVEIFKCTYDNENGEMTVIRSGEGTERVIAPGTSNDYKFTVQNTSDQPMDYDLYVEAETISSGYEIPLNVSLRADNTGYLAGSGSGGKIADLDGVHDSSVLGVGRCNFYTLSWNWPFEQGNDEYDTMLGDLSVDDTITVQVRFRTEARMNTEPDDIKFRDAGDMPTTGDETPYIMFCAVIFAAVAAVFLFAMGEKRARDNDTDKGRSL